MNNSTFRRFFVSGQNINVSLALENFVLAQGENKDFRITYSFSHKYFDQTPLSSGNSPIGFNVAVNNISSLGAENMVGRAFTFNVSLTNLDKVNGTGMTVAIVRPPSCLVIDFNFLEQLKRNNLVAYYEVRNFNSEVVLYWRYLAPAEVKTFTIDFIQRYAGSCNQKPHTAYSYYNDDFPVWILNRK